MVISTYTIQKTGRDAGVSFLAIVSLRLCRRWILYSSLLSINIINLAYTQFIYF